MKFEIFGNSHAALLTGAPPSGNIVPKSREKPHGNGFTLKHPELPFRTWFLGPILAFNFHENHLSKIYEHIRANPDKFDNDTMILLQVGEIDCRAHLPKYVNLNTSVEQVVRQCIDRYHRSISELVEKGYKVGVLGVIPSQSDGKIKSLLSGSELVANLSGNTNLRRDICLEWERYHSSICKNQSIPYISIYEKLTDKDGFAIEDFYVDSIHLSHDKTINLWIQSFKDANLM